MMVSLPGDHQPGKRDSGEKEGLHIGNDKVWCIEQKRRGNRAEHSGNSPAVAPGGKPPENYGEINHRTSENNLRRNYAPRRIPHPAQRRQPDGIVERLIIEFPGKGSGQNFT